MIELILFFLEYFKVNDPYVRTLEINKIGNNNQKIKNKILISNKYYFVLYYNVFEKITYFD